MVMDFVGAFGDINPYLLFVAVLWSVVWKGFALWKSARKNSPIWFAALLVINTLGILEILYIFLFSEIDLNAAGEKGKKDKISGNRVSRKKTSKKKPRRK